MFLTPIQEIEAYGFLSVLISTVDRISGSNQPDRLSYSSDFVSCILVETVATDLHYSPSFVSVFQFNSSCILSCTPRIPEFQRLKRHKKGYVGRYDKRIYFLALNHSKIETLSSLRYFYTGEYRHRKPTHLSIAKYCYCLAVLTFIQNSKHFADYIITNIASNLS